MKKSRYFLPLIAGGALFALLSFFTHEKRFGLRQSDLQWLKFAAFAALTIFCVRLLDLLIFDVIMSRRRQLLAPQLLRQILAIVLYITFITIGSNRWLGLDFYAAVATGTVFAAVLGLALQETLGNLFAGISLHMEGGYQVGDVLHSGDFIGVVEQVSWRATRIRGFSNQLVVLPNSVIARDRLEVFPRNNMNGRVLQIGVDYNVAPATALAILMQAASHIDGVAREAPVIARVGAFSDSAVIYEIKYFTRDYAMRDRIDADIRKAVWYALRRNEISFATPIRAYQQYMPPPAAGEALSREELHALLHDVDILSPLDDVAHGALTAAAKVHFYSRGEAVLHRGTTGDSMFVIHSGSVSVRIPDDSEHGWSEVAVLGAGSVVGEMALLTGEVRTADVVATSDVVAIEIGKDSLEPILRANPELAGAITEKVMQRQGHLDAIRNMEKEGKESVLDRIRAYFGL
ncbi:MAG TPA: mechanosensitive ion channel family protein [Thermoanaerobaculia bacterium]|nr:mechanosensitive ion channel family protein [Thermoanaerobaculia bacterium]